MKITPELIYIYCFILLLILIVIIIKGNELFIQYKVASSNNKKYGYQEVFQNTDEAIEIMAKLHSNMLKFVKDLKNKYPDDDRVKRLYNGFNRVEIEESPDEKDTTSYTINKGDLMALCLRKQQDGRPFHDENTLLFVIIHEMAHIASISEGHNQEFIDNFRFLLQEATQLGYYSPVNYRNSPITYCGLKVTNNPYF